MNELLSPKQVAQALGVSESSLKRWCDQGRIATVRTGGGHRRLSLADVLRFVRDHAHPLVSPEVLGLPSVREPSERCLVRARQLLADALLNGDESLSRRVVKAFLEYSRKAGLVIPQERLERPIHLACTAGIFDPYVPPEGDARMSSLSKEGLTQRTERLRKNAASQLAIRDCPSG